VGLAVAAVTAVEAAIIALDAPRTITATGVFVDTTRNNAPAARVRVVPNLVAARWQAASHAGSPNTHEAEDNHDDGDVQVLHQLAQITWIELCDYVGRQVFRCDERSLQGPRNRYGQVSELRPDATDVVIGTFDDITVYFGGTVEPSDDDTPGRASEATDLAFSEELSETGRCTEVAGTNASDGG
jgi:hypothetical protein